MDLAIRNVIVYHSSRVYVNDFLEVFEHVLFLFHCILHKLFSFAYISVFLASFNTTLSSVLSFHTVIYHPYRPFLKGNIGTVMKANAFTFIDATLVGYFYLGMFGGPTEVLRC